MTSNGKKLLQRLHSPLAYISEERSKDITIEGNKVPISAILHDEKSSRSDILELFRNQYIQIERDLLDETIPLAKREELLCEGVAIKRALHMVMDRVSGDDTEDIERWLKFGRSIG